MNIALPALAVAFAAFCVWLTVRIINRRERWAKWTAAVVVGLPVVYVASFGPICWLASRNDNDRTVSLNAVYRPVAWLLENGPTGISSELKSYARLGMKPKSVILLRHGPPPNGWLLFQNRN